MIRHIDFKFLGIQSKEAGHEKCILKGEICLLYQGRTGGKAKTWTLINVSSSALSYLLYMTNILNLGHEDSEISRGQKPLLPILSSLLGPWHQIITQEVICLVELNVGKTLKCPDRTVFWPPSFPGIFLCRSCRKTSRDSQSFSLFQVELFQIYLP